MSNDDIKPIDFLELVQKKLEKWSVPDYVPTGLQEDIIAAFGCGEYKIILVLDANGVGKTTTIINILKNIFWDHDKNYFNNWWKSEKNLFENWPWYAKKFRIIGNPSAISDDGAITTEIEKWWPPEQYSRTKDGKNHYSLYSTNTGWSGKIFSNEQQVKEFESDTLSLIVSDEPFDERLIGANNSRLREGGVWIMAATPISMAPLLDSIDDLISKGTKVKIINGTIYENSKLSGKPNHLNTKKGLWTDDQIKEFVASIPADEIDCRIYGKANRNFGKVYADFDINYHVKTFDLQDIFKTANCFQFYDPHSKYYPASVWCAMVPKEDKFIYIIYNEWPTYKTLNSHYDEIRKTKTCSLTLKEHSDIYKLMDCTHLGAEICGRFIDTRYAAGAGGQSWSTQTEGIVELFSKIENGGLIFTSPNIKTIDIQRLEIQKFLKFNTILPITSFNEPEIYVMPHCLNTIRMFQRHYYEEQNEREAEKFKDFSDAVRIGFAGMSEISYKKPHYKEQKTKSFYERLEKYSTQYNFNTVPMA